MRVMLPRRLALPGSTILVTGAASGIGRATAELLHAKGANVVLNDVSPSVEAFAATLGDRALAAVADVTDLAAMRAVVDRSVGRFGRLDVVFANAGVAPDPPATAVTIPDAEFERVFAVDTLGVWRTVKAALPQIVSNKGHVLITSSIYSYINGVVNLPYAMSKAAVAQLGRTLRVELAVHGATAGVLHPGWVDTPMVRDLEKFATVTRLREVGYPGPLGTPIPAQQVAEAAVRGIARRSARIQVPKTWIPVAAFSGLTNPVIDEYLRRHRTFRKLLAQLESESAR
jgi:NAD(P)-dependent dehydrogenase (short-subunit alcohol dehydrogenase family)